MHNSDILLIPPLSKTDAVANADHMARQPTTSDAGITFNLDDL